MKNKNKIKRLDNLNQNTFIIKKKNIINSKLSRIEKELYQ
jgi:hypothetical protein